MNDHQHNLYLALAKVKKLEAKVEELEKEIEKRDEKNYDDYLDSKEERDV